jgi:dTDP-4-amino-4,6-dideoxygalactose transaminase
MYYRYTIRVKDGRREAFRAHLLQGGIDCEVYYPILIQLQRSYIRQMGRQASFPMVEHTSPEELSLPVPPALTQQDLEEVVRAENGFFQEN